MEINKLCSIIRESISNNLKEIEDVAENAAMEAKLNAYTEAIEKVNKKIETAESLEEMKELVDDAKLNELKKHLKLLEKNKVKLEKLQEKKNKKKVVTDEPVEEAEVEEGAGPGSTNYNSGDGIENVNYEEGGDPDFSIDEEEAINESFLKMQKLAGVITESQYNEKKSLIENQVEEGAVIDTALGVAGGLVGLWALINGGAVVLGALGGTALSIADKMKDKAQKAAAKAKKEGRLDTIKPIIAKFENDEELKNMYQALPAKNNSGDNRERNKQMTAIAKYIKSKLNDEEMKYFADISAMLRTGDIA
jgi:hypothetical protein